MIAVATIVAVIVAIWQLRSNRRVACEDFARQIWLDYLKIGLENPELGETRCALARFPGVTAKDLILGDRECSQKYLWFLTIVLDTCENVLRYLPRTDWEPTLIEQLRFHRPALIEMWNDDRRFYSKALDRLVQRALAVPAPYDELRPITLEADIVAAPPIGAGRRASARVRKSSV